MARNRDYKIAETAAQSEADLHTVGILHQFSVMLEALS